MSTRDITHRGQLAQDRVVKTKAALFSLVMLAVSLRVKYLIF